MAAQYFLLVPKSLLRLRTILERLAAKSTSVELLEKLAKLRSRMRRRWTAAGSLLESLKRGRKEEREKNKFGRGRGTRGTGTTSSVSAHAYGQNGATQTHRMFCTGIASNLTTVHPTAAPRCSA
eukprot:762890-Hanusia_phi.AAC.2